MLGDQSEKKRQNIVESEREKEEENILDLAILSA